MDKENDIDQHSEDEDTVLVDEDGGFEVGWCLGGILRTQITIVHTHLWIIHQGIILTAGCIRIY